MTLLRFTKLFSGGNHHATPDRPLYAVARPEFYPGREGWVTALYGGHPTAYYGDCSRYAHNASDRWEVVDPDDPTVPAEVWTKLAEYRLCQ